MRMCLECFAEVTKIIHYTRYTIYFKLYSLILSNGFSFETKITSLSLFLLLHKFEFFFFFFRSNDQEPDDDDFCRRTRSKNELFNRNNYIFQGLIIFVEKNKIRIVKVAGLWKSNFSLVFPFC